jgi:hypothetical protein
LNAIGAWFRAGLILTAIWPAEAQIAILRIQVVEGEGTVHGPGSRSARPLTVDVTDETGRPVEGAAVTFHLPENGPGGSFANGLRTEVATTDARGRASAPSFQLNRTPGRFAIRIIASKEQARAGMESFQYVAEVNSGAGSAPTAKTAAGGRWKWALAAAVAGGALGGIVATRSRGNSSAPASASGQPPATPVSIGTPVITVTPP